jgi:HlyD family secretion protein
MKKIAIVLCGFVLTSFCGQGKGGEIMAPGIVDGDIITLKAMVSGQVDRVPAKEGSTVTKNELIVDINKDKTLNKLKELDIIASEIKINTLKLNQKQKLIASNITYLKNQVQRYRRLKKKNSISGEKLEAMQLKLLDAETTAFDLRRSLDNLNLQAQKIENQRKYLRLILKDHQVNSPVSGILIETFISPGESVFPNTPLADILDTSTLFVEIFIEEREMSSLRLGQRARIIVDGMEDRELSGSVSFFGKKAEFSPKYVISEKERQSLLYRVKIAIDRDIDVFKIGMPVTVVLIRTESGSG